MLKDVAFFANLNVASFWLAVFFNLGLGGVFLFAYCRDRAARRPEYLGFALTLWCGGAMMLFVYIMQQFCETVHRDTLLSPTDMRLALRFFQAQIVFSGITAACLMGFALAVTDRCLPANVLKSRWRFLVPLCLLGAFSPQVLRLPRGGIKGDDFNYTVIGPWFLPYVLTLVLLAFCGYVVITHGVWPERFRWLVRPARRIGVILGQPAPSSDAPRLLQKFIKLVWIGISLLFVGSVVEAFQVVFADQGNWGIPLNPRVVGWIVLDALVASALLWEVGPALFERRPKEAIPSESLPATLPDSETNAPEANSSETRLEKEDSEEDPMKLQVEARKLEDATIRANFEKLTRKQKNIAIRCNKGSKEIAAELNMTDDNVRKILSSIYVKMEIDDTISGQKKDELAERMKRIGELKPLQADMD